MNTLPSYVASSLEEPLTWNGTLLKGNAAGEVANLKDRPGQDLLIYRSGELVDGLHQHGLIEK